MPYPSSVHVHFLCYRTDVYDGLFSKISQLFLHFCVSSLTEEHVFRLLTHSLFFLKTCAIETLELLMWLLLLTPHVTNWRLPSKFSSASQDIWCLLAAQNIYPAWSQLMKNTPKTLSVFKSSAVAGFIKAAQGEGLSRNVLFFTQLCFVRTRSGRVCS